MDPLEQLHQFAQDNDIRDWQLYSFSQNQLIITGSTDHNYYHQIEARFEGARYLSIPVEFSNAKFQYADEFDRENIGKQVELEQSDLVFAIEAETMASIHELNFFLVASSLEINLDMVYHYHRETLRENERLASWLNKKQA